MQRLFFVALAAMAFSGCTKHITSRDPIQTGCRIETLTPAFTPGRTYIFNYDADGQPVSIIPSIEDSYTSGVQFSYDGQKRLIKMAFHSGAATEYLYSGNLSLPSGYTCTDPFGNSSKGSFEYDNAGRIISRSESETSTGYLTNVHFYYDVNGNLTVDPANTEGVPPIAYTNHPSIYSLNDVWKLINLNFSANTQEGNLTYSTGGLPVFFNGVHSVWGDSFLGHDLSGTHITYACSTNEQ